MAIPMLKQDGDFVYKDYRSWPVEERWELVEGAAWNMSPAANRIHQEISMYLSKKIAVFLEDKPCRVYAAPFDVVLPDSPDQPEDLSRTVVQPDLSVICDESKLTDRGCCGPPDLVVEILSPYTWKKDTTLKLDLYQKHGVREYWIVDPAEQSISVYPLNDSRVYPRKPTVFTYGDTVVSGVLQGLNLNLEEMFRE